MTQEGPPGSLRLLDTAEIVHRNQEVLFIVYLERRVQSVEKERHGKSVIFTTAIKVPGDVGSLLQSIPDCAKAWLTLQYSSAVPHIFHLFVAFVETVILYYD